MSRQSRLITILAAMALVGVVVLVLVAGRYSRLIDRDDDPGQSAAPAAQDARDP